MAFPESVGSPAENQSAAFAAVKAYFAKFKAPPFLLYNLQRDQIPGKPEMPPEGNFLFADSDRVSTGVIEEIRGLSELDDLQSRLAGGVRVVVHNKPPSTEDGWPRFQSMSFSLTMANPTVALQFLEGMFGFGNPGAIDVDAGELFGYKREVPEPLPQASQDFLRLPQPVEAVVLAPVEGKPGKWYCTPRLHPNTPLGVQITSGVPGSPIFELAGLYYPFGRNVWWKEVGTV